MTCPHYGARPKPVDQPEQKAAGLKYYVSRAGREMYDEFKPFIYAGIEPLMDKFSVEVLERGIAKLKFPDDPDLAAMVSEVSEYGMDYDLFTRSVTPMMRRVLANIHEFDRHSSRGPGCRLAELLNGIGLSMCEWIGIPTSASREFNCRFGFESTGKKLCDLDANREPEIVVVDRDAAQDRELTWADVCCPMVVFEDRRYVNTAVRQLLGYAHRIFYEQSRNYVLGVGYFGSHFLICLFDRSGAYISNLYPMADTYIVRLIAGLLFAEKSDLGYDLSVLMRGDRYYVRVNGDEYLVKDVLTRNWGVVGPGTSVRVVKRNGKTYVNKDVWVVTSDQSKEPETMKRISGVKNIVQLEALELLKTPYRVPVTTIPHRQWVLDEMERFKEEKFTCRIYEHYQLIMTPFGDNLNSFTSLEELFSALRDVGKAIKQLRKKGVYHADVNHRNIVLAPKSDPSARLRKGCLTDFGVSIDHRQESMDYNNPRGQLFYMSLDVLQAGVRETKIEHRTYHDFESLFYVLCWECTSHNGPNVSCCTDEELEDSIITRWSAKNSTVENQWADAYEAKYKDVQSEEAFEKNVLAHFQPYFRDLIPCARALRNILCQRKYTPEERKELRWRHTQLVREKNDKERRASPIVTLYWEIEDAWQLVMDARPFWERERGIMKDVLKVLDRTLATIRRKAGITGEVEVEEETDETDEEDEDYEEEAYEEEDREDREEDREVMEDIEDKEEGREEDMEDMYIPKRNLLTFPLSWSSDDESTDPLQANADSPRATADFSQDAAEVADDPCHCTECKGKGRVVAVSRAVVEAPADASCHRCDDSEDNDVAKDNSCTPLDASSGRGGDERIETPATSTDNTKRKRMEEDEDEDKDKVDDSGNERDSVGSIPKKRKLEA